MSTRSKRFHRIIHSSNRRRGGAAAVAPEYSSGEIGVVDSETVEITFSEDMDTDSDYTTGVTIMVGSVSYTGFSGTRQADKSKVRYVLVAGVDGTETVTWAYSKSSGGIKSESGGVALEDVSAQAITNTAFEPGDLAGTDYWWHVRPSAANGVTGSDGDAISTWTENAGVETFTQTLTARPTLQTNEINGMSVLRFDGINDNMVSDLTLTEIFANGAKTAWFVIKINTMGPSAIWYSNDGIFVDQGGYWGAAVDDVGVLQGNQNGSNDEVHSAASIDTVYVVEMRHDSGTIYTSLNGGSETSTVSGNTADLTNDLRVGANYNASVFFDGDIAEIVTSNQAESSANRTNIRNVLMNIYDLVIFYPSIISGLVTFVEVDRGVEETDGSVPENGENIAAWRDEWSGNDNDFLQGVTDKQPVYDTSLFGGYSAVCGGVDDFMVADIAAARIDTADDLYVIIALHTPTGWTGSGENFISCLDSANNRGWALYCTSSKLRVNMAHDYLSSSLQVNGSTVYAADTNYIIEVIYNGQDLPVPADIEIYVDGVEDSYTTESNTLSTNTIQGTGDVDIATQQGGAGSFMDADYAAVGIYTTIPTVTERAGLRNYLSNKYGV